MGLPILDYQSPDDRRRLDELVQRLRDSASATGQVDQAVARIVDDVRRHGDEAVVRYMKQWTDPDFTADRIRVTAEELAAAEQSLDDALKAAMSQSIENVRRYQQHILPDDPPTVDIGGAQLGMRFVPMERVGLAVPGGTASYPSSVIMLAVPAQVAGVERLCVVSPPPTVTPGTPAGDISPLVLGVCHMLGVDEVYRIGGAQAMAALAYGTETVPPVDYIAGPGNAYVQQAKRQLFGLVGIDGFFGPSEVVVLADDSADPARIAADLIAQAEHDPGCCFLVATDRAVIEKIVAAIEQQLPQRNRRQAVESALADWSAAICTGDRATALELVDRLAGEHVTLAVADPQATLGQLKRGGAWFLGDTTPVASGDYYAGPSHALPTGTTARFTSGLSVYTFLTRSSVEYYPAGMSDRAIDDIIRLAEAEGLDGHAESVQRRKN